jgi:hypothetical protein
MSTNETPKVLRKCEGTLGCFNDVVVFTNASTNAKYNLVYFGGDIQVWKKTFKPKLKSSFLS